MNFLICSETWLTEKTTNNEIIEKLDNWKIIKRLDATDNRKHMDLMLMIPKGQEASMQLVFDMDYIEGFSVVDATLLYQGLTMNITK